MDEIWKQITDYTNYKISNKGRVKNKYNRILNLDINKAGYLNVSVYKNSKRKHFSIHRLIAIYFIDNPDNKKCVLIHIEESQDLLWETDNSMTLINSRKYDLLSEIKKELELI